MKKISIFCIVLLIVGLLGSQVIGTEDIPVNQVKTVKIRVESGYKYSLNNIENFKTELKEDKVKLILVYCDEEFAKGYIGLNDKQDGLKYIYLPHTKYLGNPEYVRQYNKVREAIYNLSY